MSREEILDQVEAAAEAFVSGFDDEPRLLEVWREARTALEPSLQAIVDGRPMSPDSDDFLDRVVRLVSLFRTTRPDFCSGWTESETGQFLWGVLVFLRVKDEGGKTEEAAARAAKVMPGRVWTPIPPAPASRPPATQEEAIPVWVAFLHKLPRKAPRGHPLRDRKLSRADFIRELVAVEHEYRAQGWPYPTEADVADKLNISRPTLRKYRRQYRIPRPKSKD